MMICTLTFREADCKKKDERHSLSLKLLDKDPLTSRKRCRSERRCPCKVAERWMIPGGAGSIMAGKTEGLLPDLRAARALRVDAEIASLAEELSWICSAAATCFNWGRWAPVDYRCPRSFRRVP